MPFQSVYKAAGQKLHKVDPPLGKFQAAQKQLHRILGMKVTQETDSLSLSLSLSLSHTHMPKQAKEISK